MIDPEIAAGAVRLALERGATGAECTLAEGEEFSANVRMRQVETVKEAGSRGAGLRVLLGQRAGSSYTSDLSRDGIDKLVRSALEIAEIGTDDPHAGLPEAEGLGSLPGDLQLYCGEVSGIPAEYKIDQALAAEEAALSFDPRINNSEGASFDSSISQRVFANSRGFVGSYRSSSCSMTAVPVAKHGDAMERDYWFSLARGPHGLETPEAIGRRAAERTIRRLGAQKISTRKATIVFEPRTARSLLGHIFEAVEGNSVYRKASFLAGRIGDKVAPDNVTMVDDATIPGLFGTSPFDDEGVPSRRTVIIERGFLRSYLLNSYTARKLGLRTTGNASRGLTGSAGVGHGNLYLEPGEKSPDDLLRAVGTGLYVTELIGSGVNTLNGDYSRGAAGLWIENGELAFPVAEVTIAGNLRQMLLDIEYVGADLEFRGSTASPTLAIREMTISGR